VRNHIVLEAPIHRPAHHAAARDWAVRDYRTHLQAVAKRAPRPVSNALAAVDEAASLRALLTEHRIEVELFDERLTTVTAHRALAAGGARERDRRGTVDQAAAAVMLEAWLRTTGSRR